MSKNYSPARIESAELHDGRCKVQTRMSSGGKISTYLKDSDIKRAVKRLHLRTVPKSDADISHFCSIIEGKVLEIEQGGKESVSIEDACKQERKRMSDNTKKVEFKLQGIKDMDGATLHSFLVSKKAEIRTKANIGSSLKQIISAKPGDSEDKKDEFTVVISFTKNFAEKDEFDEAMCEVAKVIKGMKAELGDNVKVQIEKKD